MGGWARRSQAQPVVDRVATICRIDTTSSGARLCPIDKRIAGRDRGARLIIFFVY